MEWVSVKDRKPEGKGRYLCYIEGFEDSENCDGWYYTRSIVRFDRFIKKTIYEDDRIIHILGTEMDFETNSDGYTSSEVTHWIEIPKAP